MLVGKPILSGESDGHQLELIFDLCGTPTDDNMPGWRTLPGAEALQPRPRQGNLSQRFREHGSGAVSLLRELLKLDWRSRVNAIDALQHPYFRTAPFPAKPHELPSFEESHELDRRKFHDRRAALPPAPKGGTVGRGPHDGPNASFSSDGFSSRNGVNGGGGGRYPRNSRGPGERVPAWRRGGGDHALPPRPPPPADADHPDGGGGGYRDRGGRPPRGGAGGAPGGGGRPDVDTYIPSYDRDAPRRDDRRRPPRDDRDDRRHDGWDRRRDYDDRARTSRTRSRSRSPIRDRERERDRDRDRDRDREREVYSGRR
jgi:serine/threonine-protein kinase BUR1